MVQLKENVTPGEPDGAFSTSCLSRDPAWPGGHTGHAQSTARLGWKLGPDLTPQTKRKKKKGKTIHCLEDAAGEYLHDLGIDKDSQRRPRMLAIRES